MCVPSTQSALGWVAAQFTAPTSVSGPGHVYMVSCSRDAYSASSHFTSKESEALSASDVTLLESQSQQGAEPTSDPRQCSPRVQPLDH